MEEDVKDEEAAKDGTESQGRHRKPRKQKGANAQKKATDNCPACTVQYLPSGLTRTVISGAVFKSLQQQIHKTGMAWWA
jgi:hypothetical protein